MTSARVVLVTFPNVDEGRRIGRVLLERGLIQCVNLLPGAESLYVWEGQIEEDSEVVGILKTTTGRVDALEAAIDDLHPYKVPEFLVLGVEQGSEQYLKWLGAC